MPGIAGHITGRDKMAGLALLALLAGCAGPPPAPPAQPVPALHAGIVVSTRQVSIGPNDGARIGVNDVLTALGQTAPAGPVSGQEVVILLPEQTPAVMVPSPVAGQPAFRAGDHVAIVQSASSALVHQN